MSVMDEASGPTFTTVKVSRILRTLSVETFVLNLESELDAAPEIPGYVVRLIDPQTLEVDAESGRGINEMFHRLSELDLRVVSMRNKSNRLEELFMRLVDSKEARLARSGS